MDVFQVVKALRVQKPGAVHTVVGLASQHAVSSVCVCYIINPRRVCAARVTVVVLCVCLYLCVYVCPLIPAASHIGITKERYQIDSAQFRDRFKFC